MRYGENLAVNVESIPTGSLSLDLALGIGGVPKGRIIEIYGPESSGKTTLALHIIASAQKKGGEVAFIDAEHALEPAYARALGVDIESLLIAPPDTGEDALAITESLCALVPLMSSSSTPSRPSFQREIEGEMATPGWRRGRLCPRRSESWRAPFENDCIVIFINQLREKIGVSRAVPRRRGRRALKYFAASDRCPAHRIPENGSEVVGKQNEAKSSKTRLRRR
jgi:recombination protein RecA